MGSGTMMGVADINGSAGAAGAGAMTGRAVGSTGFQSTGSGGLGLSNPSSVGSGSSASAGTGTYSPQNRLPTIDTTKLFSDVKAGVVDAYGNPTDGGARNMMKYYDQATIKNGESLGRDYGEYGSNYTGSTSSGATTPTIGTSTNQTSVGLGGSLLPNITSPTRIIDEPDTMLR